MAVDARPLAHSPARRRLRALLGLALGVGLALSGCAARTSPAGAPSGDAVVPDLPPAAYEEAERAGSAGSVRGRAYLEPGRLGGADQPLAALTVTLLPRSEGLLVRLAALKRQLREEPRRYPSSAEAVTAARLDYEQALARGGGERLVRRAVSGPDGTFEFGTVPAGPWLLVAERTVFVERSGPAQPRRERQVFGERPRLLGYQTVTFWVREVSVLPGAQVTVELNDRNAWLTAVTEKRTPDAVR